VHRDERIVGDDAPDVRSGLQQRLSSGRAEEVREGLPPGGLRGIVRNPGVVRDEVGVEQREPAVEIACVEPREELQHQLPVEVGHASLLGFRPHDAARHPNVTRW
jgi:hypothetical protein